MHRQSRINCFKKYKRCIGMTKSPKKGRAGTTVSEDQAMHRRDKSPEQKEHNVHMHDRHGSDA
eukprot:1136612-Pelagomonas_calceolata.AAC.7